MRAFVIPSIFTAVDKFTAPIRAMTRNAAEFANKAEGGLSRADRVFRKLTPTLNQAQKQLFNFASSAALAGAIVGGVVFSVDSIKQYEDAVASFRVIVGGTDKQFAPFQKAINDVAKDTSKSAVEVAASFEKIAGLNAKFAETPEAIKAVSSAVITLSKASGDELGSSAESLVGIMNQFGFAANQANRTINVLAAGASVGAASIVQTAESFVNFGSVAKGANITLEQSVALIQTLASKGLTGAEAGTKLRGAILKLQQAGLGYKSGQFQINDALEDARQKIDKLKTAKQKDLAILKIFGAENISTGKILLSSQDAINEFTKGVTNTNEAQKAAELRSGTLTTAIEELKAAWVNMITSTDGASTALNYAKKIIQFVARNLNTIVSIGVKVIAFFIGFKILLAASRAVLVGYNIVLGVTSALTMTSSTALRGNIVALGAQKVAIGLVTAAQWLWNAAMTANPIGLIVVAIAAAIGWITLITKKWNDWGAAISFTLGPLGAVISLIQSVRRNWEGIKKAFTEEGIVAGLKKIGATLLDMFIMPLQQVFKLLSKLPSWLGGGLAADANKALQAVRVAAGANVDTDENGNPLNPTPAVNTKAVEQKALLDKVVSTNNARVDLRIHDPHNRVEATANNNNFIKINTTTTMPSSGGN